MEQQSRNSISQLSLSQRIWKYKLHYIIVIPALILIITFKIVPLLYGFILSYEDYTPFRGIIDSEWVGFNNFNQLFDNADFRNVFSNTIVIKIGYILLSGITALIMALVLSSIRSNWLRQTFSTIFLIPFFIPAIVFASVAMLAVSPSKSPLYQGGIFLLTEPHWFSPFLIFIEVLKTCGIPILIALAAIASKHHSLSLRTNDLPHQRSSYVGMNLIPALRAVFAFMLLQMSTILSTDFELIHSLLNPLVRESGDMIETFIYQIGLVNGNYSVAAAVRVIQFGIQLVFTAAAYFMVRSLFFKDLFHSLKAADSKPMIGSKGIGIIGIVIAAIFSVVSLLPLYFLFVYPFTLGSSGETSLIDGSIIWQLIVTFIISCTAVVIHLLMTITLAYPLTVKTLPGRRLYKLFLLFALSIGVGGIGEYMFFRNLEMVNTIFPSFILGFFNIVSVFVLKSIFNSKYSDLKEKAEREGIGELHTLFNLFIPKVWKPLVALGVLQFVSVWNSYYQSFVYISNAEHSTALMRFMQISYSQEAGTSSHLLLGALLTLPPVILFLLVRKWLTSEVFISQIRKL